jgi:type IV secretion system protein VirB9
MMVTQRASVLLAVLALSACLAQGEALPTKGTLDARIRSVPYQAEQLYRLYGFVGYALELIFEEGETVTGEGGGDLEGLTFGVHANHLILKPKAVKVGTNLIVYTDRRAYRFEYSASAEAPDLYRDEVMYAVRFIYPPPTLPPAAAPTNGEQAQRALAQAGQGRTRNLDYGYCGSPILKPIAASDDGVQTRITFTARGELPAIFLSNEDGSESLVNFHMEGADVVVHRIAHRFILRRGRLTGCIVNEAFSGTADLLPSGTIAPQVERTLKGAAP